MKTSKVILAFIFVIIAISYTKSQTVNDSKFANGFKTSIIKSLNKSKYEILDTKKFADKYELSKFFLKMESEKLFGFIGFEMERIKIKITDVGQDKDIKSKYHIDGITKVDKSIQKFSGELRLSNVYSFKEVLTNHGLVICEFDAILNEICNKSVNAEHCGKFVGNYYLILSKVVDDIRFPKVIPKYIQNYTFAGNWISNNKKMNYPVLWGENYLLEELADFYYGITLSPEINESLINKNWQNYFDAYTEGVKINIQNKALQIEKQQWWK